MTTSAARPGRRPLLPWLVGLVLVAGLVAVLLHHEGLALSDRDQQQPLVQGLAEGDVAGALDTGQSLPQTSGPGFGLYGALPYLALRPFASPERAYDVVSLLALGVLAVAVVATSRLLGIERRSGRELVVVAAAVLGAPTLACYVEAFHPADVLATAACLGAVVLVGRERVGAAAVLLGFAVATRQWAVVAVAVLAVLLDRRERSVLVAGSMVTFLVLLAPFVLADPGPALDALAAREVVQGGVTVAGLVPFDPQVRYLVARYVPLALVALWCLWLHRRRTGFEPELAVAALTVALLVRPLVDPAGFVYYVAPAAAVGVLLRPRSWRWPVLVLLGGAALWERRSLRFRYRSPADLGVALDRPAGTALSVAATALLALALVAAARRAAELLATGRPPRGEDLDAA